MVLVQVTVDDIDNSPGAQPVKFSLGDSAYVIDLAPKNMQRLEKALAPFIEHARQAKGAIKPPKIGEVTPPDAPEPTEQAVQAAVKSVGRKTKAARKVVKPSPTMPTHRPGIRDWAIQQGLIPENSGSGRMPRAIEIAYDNAHATKKSTKS